MQYDAADLRQAAARSRDADAARRMLALALVLDGRPRTEAAPTCGMDRQTLRDWVHRYNVEGLAGLSNRKAPGPAPRLSIQQQAEVAALVRAGPDLEEHGIVRWRRSDGAHAIVIVDGAEWHKPGGRLRQPDNISMLVLPPYSPELNPQENIWQFLRQNYLSNRIFATYSAIVDACCAAWNALVGQSGTIASIASRKWAEKVTV